jgi:hypothetical protein
VKDLRSNQEGFLNLDIIAQEPSRLRLEITGALGVHVASVALNGAETRYILTREKRFVSSPADSNSLVRLIPVRIHPSALMSVLFERELPKDSWRCERDGSIAPVLCRHKSEGVEIKWLERKGRARRLKITARDAEVEMLIDESKSKVEFDPKAFELTAPRGFTQEKLN